MNDNFKENTQYKVDSCPFCNSQNLTFGGKSQRSDVYSSCLPNIAKDDPSLAPTPMKIHYLAP